MTNRDDEVCDPSLRGGLRHTNREAMMQQIASLKSCPCWGVVSTWAADTMYGGFTYDQAVAKAAEETREPGRSALIVLVVDEVPGTPPAIVRQG
jgi:hypothetical protein